MVRQTVTVMAASMLMPQVKQLKWRYFGKCMIFWWRLPALKKQSNYGLQACSRHSSPHYRYKSRLNINCSKYSKHTFQKSHDDCLCMLEAVLCMMDQLQHLSYCDKTGHGTSPAGLPLEFCEAWMPLAGTFHAVFENLSS